MEEYLGTGVGPGELGSETDDGEGGVFFGGRDDGRHCCCDNGKEEREKP